MNTYITKFIDEQNKRLGPHYAISTGKTHFQHIHLRWPRDGEARGRAGIV